MKRESPILQEAVLVLAAILAGVAGAVASDRPTPCTEDAMIVFDASGSMSGNTNPGIGNTTPRIDEVRKALEQVLPQASRLRKIGLVTYGPGPYRQCNVSVDLKPTPRANDRIMQIVNNLVPAGKTPLTKAVLQAAEALDYRNKPGIIVVMTDGEETCGGLPCGLGGRLEAEGMDLTVHVIGFRLDQYLLLRAQSYMDARCLAEKTGGLYIKVENRDELARAFEQTLGCPMMSELDAHDFSRHVSSSPGAVR